MQSCLDDDKLAIKIFALFIQEHQVSICVIWYRMHETIVLPCCSLMGWSGTIEAITYCFFLSINLVSVIIKALIYCPPPSLCDMVLLVLVDKTYGMFKSWWLLSFSFPFWNPTSNSIWIISNNEQQTLALWVLLQAW